MSGHDIVVIIILACLMTAFVYVNFILPRKNNNDKGEK